MVASPVDRLVQHALGARLDRVPEDVRDRARALILDTLAVGWAGSSAPGAAELVEAASGWGEGSAPVIGLPGGRSRPTAAALNGFHIHCLEWDGVHEQSVVHAMSVTTAALVAELDRAGTVTGADWMMAIIVGVDVAAALGQATLAPLSFFRPAVAGTLGATLALARLRGFSPDRAKDALGLAYSQLAGTMQAHVEGSQALALQVAMAARNAQCAADMAEAGLSGPHDILEGPFGYFRLFEEGGDPAMVVRDLGREWRIGDTSHKPFPSGRASHAVLDVLLRARERFRLGLDEVRSVSAHVPPLIHRLVARPWRPAMSPSYARLCLPYLAGLALRDGRIDPTAFTEKALRDPELGHFAERVDIQIDDNPDQNALSPQAVSLQFTDGTIFDERIEATLGAPDNPLTEQMLMAKVHRCAELARFPVPAGNVMALAAFCEALEDQPNISAIIDLVRPTAH